MNEYPRTEMYRSRPIRGKYINGIRYSHSDYSLIDLAVYEDGVLRLGYDYMDLDMLTEAIMSGQLTPIIPAGSSFYSWHLGGWTIEKAHWLYHKSNYCDFIVSVVQSMNPQLENLFRSNGKLRNPVGNISYGSFTDNERMVRSDGPNTGIRQTYGIRHSYLYKISLGEYWFCSLDVFSDSKILIYGTGERLVVTPEEVAHLVETGVLVSRIPAGSTIRIEDLGEITISKENYCVDVREKLKEIPDTIARLNDQPTLQMICYKAYEEYNKDPTAENKERLRVAYENVPAHKRIYVLADQDLKDGPICEILGIRRWQ